jgi:preprotein translocase subunit SecB
MEPSRLRLETYHFAKISIIPRPQVDATPLGQFADISNVEIKSNVTLHQLADVEGPMKRQGLSLEVVVSPGDNDFFPYSIEMEIMGVFDTNDLPADKRDVLLLVNGSSMLYSAMREMLLTITQRCLHGPVMLPSVSFTWLERNHQAKVVENAGQPLP